MQHETGVVNMSLRDSLGAWQSRSASLARNPLNLRNMPQDLGCAALAGASAGTSKVFSRNSERTDSPEVAEPRALLARNSGFPLPFPCSGTWMVMLQQGSAVAATNH